MKSTLAPFLATATIVSMLVARPVAAQDDRDNWDDDSAPPVEIHGFVEAATGGRIVDDPTQPDDLLMNEARFRLDLSHYRDRAEFKFKGDLLTDGITGDTSIDIRRASVLLRASSWLDITAGRQVLTWGTGDLLFLNDRFPKDFVAFFIGRDDEFLKAPSNAFKATFYSAPANLDVVWTPEFTPDTYITGERLSFYSPMKPGRTSAYEMGGPLPVKDPADKWDNGELAARLFRNVKGWELAAYGYGGFWNQPNAVDFSDTTFTFTELSVYGASARGNLLGGIGNLEGAYYDSRRDRDGTNPALPNSQVRGLAGYERELTTDLSAGVQYYAEWTADYDSLVSNAPSSAMLPEEIRQLVTLRLTQRLMQQTLTLSLFGYYSPNEEDGYIRPVISRDWSDAVNVTLGANVMWGDAHTFFGQLRDNTNVHLQVRYSF